MSVFVTRDGRTVESRPHEATFLGKHNEPKSKILLFLMDRKHRGIITGFTAKQLHMETGVNYNYLLTKLSKWAKWGGPCFSYIIGDRGIHFVH